MASIVSHFSRESLGKFHATEKGQKQEPKKHLANQEVCTDHEVSFGLEKKETDEPWEAKDFQKSHTRKTKVLRPPIRQSLRKQT